jgi:hypothetical protein
MVRNAGNQVKEIRAGCDARYNGSPAAAATIT